MNNKEWVLAFKDSSLVEKIIQAFSYKMASSTDNLFSKYLIKSYVVKLIYNEIKLATKEQKENIEKRLDEMVNKGIITKIGKGVI